MKKLITASAVILGATLSSALAADMPVKATAALTAFNWTGFYGGVHGGYGWGSNEIYDGVSLGSFSYKPAGGFGGGQIGYNSHFAPHWLIGAEIDVSAGNPDDSLVQFSAPTIIGKNKLDWFGTARTRFGYVQDRTLVYVTGGVMWVSNKFSARDVTNGLTEADVRNYHVGGVIGGGIEYAFDPRWSFKIEYLYAPFDTTHDIAGGTVVNRTSDLTFNTVKAGVNYRFGDAGNTASLTPVKSTASPSSWNGGYLGLHGGYAWTNWDWSLANVSGSATPNGAFGGLQSGYNWLFTPRALFGIEIDASWGDLKERGFVQTTLVPGTLKIDDLGTARLRLGYLLNPDALVYGTGGVGYAREESSYPGGAYPSDAKVDHVGWTAGGGIEWKFTPLWSAKIEYLYMDLGSAKNGATAYTKNADLTLNTVKIGINYSGPLIEQFFGSH